LILRVQNFCRHADTTLDLSGQGIVLLGGKNGSGKTSLVPDGLCFGWYGKTLRGVSGKDVVRREAGKHCCVTIEDTTLDGKPYVLRRYVSWPGKPTAVLAIEGEEEVFGAQEVTAAVQQRITGCSFGVFSVSRVFGKKFFTQLGDSERKAVLDEVVASVGAVDFPALTAGHKRAAEYYATLQAEMTELPIVLAMLDDRIVEVKADVAEATERVQEVTQLNWQGKVKHWKDLASTHKGALAHFERELKQMVAARATVLAQLDDAALVATEAEAAWQATRAGLKEAEAACTQMAKQLANLQALRKRFQSLEGKCATCLQSVPETHSFTVLERITSKEAALTDEYKTVIALRSNATALDALAYTKWQAKTAAKSTLSTSLQHTHDKIIQLGKSIKDSKERIAECEVKAAVLGTKEAQLADAQAALHRAELKLAAVKLERQAKNDKLADLLRLSLHVEHWLKGFSPQGIRSFLLDVVLPTLNTEAADIASILTGGKLSVLFDTQTTLKSGDQKERFDVRVLLHGVEVPYDTCSAGEQKRADIITTLALGRASKAFTNGPLLVVDEVFDGLDEDGIDGAVELLSHLASFYSTVAVVTHDKAFASRFDRVALVEAVDGGSIVTWHEGGADAFEG
jgi:DNA repair exonuclease SbcCD ATPase subunit